MGRDRDEDRDRSSRFAGAAAPWWICFDYILRQRLRDFMLSKEKCRLSIDIIIMLSRSTMSKGMVNFLKS